MTLYGRHHPQHAMREAMNTITTLAPNVRTISRIAGLVALVSTASCSDQAYPAGVSREGSVPKGGPPAPTTAYFTITDAGLSVQSDGKGVYRTDICGVLGTWDGIGGFFGPASVKIPKSQQASCASIAPRT